MLGFEPLVNVQQANAAGQWGYYRAIGGVLRLTPVRLFGCWYAIGGVHRLTSVCLLRQ